MPQDARPRQGWLASMKDSPLLRWLKVAIVVVAFAYLAAYVHAILQQGGAQALVRPDSVQRAALAAIAFASTIAWSILGWRWLLKRLSWPLPLRPIARIFGSTQIGKYIPGNIGHHVGRVALAKANLGIPVAVSVASIGQETALVLVSAMLVALACFTAVPVLNLPQEILGFGPGSVMLAVLAGVAGLVMAAQWVRRRDPSWARRWPLPAKAIGFVPSPWTVCVAIALYIPIYVINGIGVSAIAAGYVPFAFHDAVAFTGAYACAWMIGFVLPGAPGGLGVREASMLALLDGVYPPEAVLAVTLLARLSSVLADLLVFGLSMMLPGKATSPPTEGSQPR